MELVIVLLVMSVMAAVATPKFYDSLMYHRAESAARRIEADLHQLQQAARRTSVSHSMTFTGSSYTLPSDIDSLGKPTGTYLVDLTATPYSLDAVALRLDAGNVLTFNGHGMPAGGGDIELRSGDYVRTVSLDKDTGQVSILRTSKADDVEAEGSIGL